MSGEDRIVGKRYSHFLKGNLLDPFHLVIGSSKWFTENCWEPGVFVDAFDVKEGDFVNDNFVDVKDEKRNLDTNLGKRANDEGFVPTAEFEYVDAFPSIHSGPFRNWQIVVGDENVNNSELEAVKDSIAVAVAFYEKPTAPLFTETHEQSGWIYVSPGVKVDGGGVVIGPDGIPHPVDPWGPLTAKLLSTIAILSVSQNMSEKIRREAIDLAARHVASVAEEIRRSGKK